MIPPFLCAALLYYPLSFEDVVPLLRRCFNLDCFNKGFSGVAASLSSKEVISIFNFIHFDFLKQLEIAPGSPKIIDRGVFFAIMAGMKVWNNEWF